MCHDFLPPPRRGSHVKSDNAHTQLSNTPLSPYAYLTTAPWASLVAPYLQFTPTSLQAITNRAREGGPKEHGQAKMAAWNWCSYICTRALHSFLCFTHCRAASAVIPLDTRPRPPSHHPSSLTSVYLIPDLDLLLPSTPFWPYGTHPCFPHAKTISILSDPLYSLMAPLDDQLWMPSLRGVTHVAAWRNNIFNKFRVHGHERERMTMFINWFMNAMHNQSVCGCQRSWDGQWIDSHQQLWTFVNTQSICIEFNILPDKLYWFHPFLSFVSIVLYKCSLSLIGRTLDKTHMFI